MKRRFLFFGLFLLLMTACQKGNFHREGEKISTKLAQELEEVQTLQQLLSREQKIQTKMNTLIDLMIQAKKYEKKHGKPLPQKGNHKASDSLKTQLERIYAIDGCQEVFEKWQKEGLSRLDACVNSSRKR
jgi:hypothetical protein